MSASPTKTQFYSANGAGRDSYIYTTNGGFCPPKEPCRIEALGKWLLIVILLQIVTSKHQKESLLFNGIHGTLTCTVAWLIN